MKDYFKIKEGQQLSSIQDLYLTHTTMMKFFIDSDTYDNMMVRVIKDILENDEIVETIKKLRRKDRRFLAPIIYNWARREWDNHPALPQPQYGVNKYGFTTLITHPKSEFYERFEEAFHPDIAEECRYQYEAFYLDFKTTFKDNKYNIVMFEGPKSYYYREVYGRMVVKYNENSNTLKISYIENIKWNTIKKFGPQRFRVEMFREVRKIMNQIEEKKGEEPKIICHKKYQHLLEEAKKRGYLDKPKKEKEEEFDMII